MKQATSHSLFWTKLLITGLSAITLNSCGQEPGMDIQGGSFTEVELATGISRSFPLSSDDLDVKVSNGDAIVALQIVDTQGKRTSYRLVPWRKGTTKVSVRSKGNLVSQVNVTVYDEEKKREEIIDRQSAEEDRQGLPVEPGSIPVGSYLVTAVTVRDTGAIYITDPSVVTVTRLNHSVKIAALKTGRTDVTIYDESGAMVHRVYVRAY